MGSTTDEARMTAIRAACEHLKIKTPQGIAARLSPPGGGAALEPPAAGAAVHVVDIRSFGQEKRPSSANEMAAVTAFYLSELAPDQDRKTEVEVEDMTKYFKQANFRLPKNPRMVLVSARHAGYFDPAGDGKYRLNAVGYNLVAHNLPRTASDSAARQPRARKQNQQGKKTRKAR
jgi:hypothetical protein